MCGIAVAIDWDEAEAAVAQLIGGLLHRGDVTDPVVAPRPRSAFCTRRLRIVDGAHGVQPALSWDGRMAVAFNGEIYNHRALRAELEAAGAQFTTEGDSEVLAAALSVWGGRALGRLSGMYAFVAMDLSSGEFLAARDPFGIKPLYLIRSTQGWLFCSEMAPLLETVQDGDVLLLPPGHFLTRKTIGAHAAPPADDAPSTALDADALDRVLAQAVEAHLPPDLPFATFFSGGLDSTLIAHYARRVRRDAPAYFLGDAQSPDHPFAAAYAEQTGLELREVGLDASETALAALLPALVGAVEGFEPEVVRDAHCNWLLSEAAQRDGFRVVLAGEGADELFVGYAPVEAAFAQAERAGRDLRRQTLEQMGRTNLQRLDRCAMRFGIEARVPFLDPSVSALALAYGGADLVHASAGSAIGKQPLRAVYARHPEALPAAIAKRRKLGLHIGCGLDRAADSSPWARLAERTISDKAFADGQRRLAGFPIASKEHLLFFEALERRFDPRRVPHLRHRAALLGSIDRAA